MKTFLILKITPEMGAKNQYTELEELVHNFIDEAFDYDEDIHDKTTIRIEDWCSNTEDGSFEQYLTVKIEFNEFKYVNPVHGVCIEYIGMNLLRKGQQPFFDGSKYFTRTVYEEMQGLIFQKHKEAYGVNTLKLYEDFLEFVLTC